MNPRDAAHPLAAPFARWLAGLAPEPAQAAARRAGRALVEARAAGDTWIEAGEDAAVLAGCGLAGPLDGATPLVAEGQRLWLRACRAAEAAIAGRILARAAAAPRQPSHAQERLAADPAADPAQQAAVRTACARPLAVVTGGPGRGKTWTLVRAIAADLVDDPSRRVCLAAPTGKAAQRLREAVAQALPALAVPDAVRDAIAAAAARATTVHRLLGYRPDRDQFRHWAGEPLPADLVVVDEAGMLDLHLADALTAALDPATGLVLAGDADQLPSVEAGGVFAALVAAGGAVAACTTVLTRDFRTDAASLHLRALAEAMRTGDADAAWEVLHAGGASARLCSHAAAEAEVWALCGPAARCAIAAADPAEALAAAGAARILCAVRDGPWGVTGWVGRVRHRLGLVDGDPRGPVLVTVNDATTRLANGDVGACLAGSAWFADPLAADGRPRAVPLASLPTHEPAWAMTVHKAQGSEHPAVALVLPPEPHPLATRALLYTGITRARGQVLVVATRAGLAAALADPGRRRSGLGGLLL